MAMLMLQRDGNGCMQRSYRPRPKREFPSVILLRALAPMGHTEGGEATPAYRNDAGVREMVVSAKDFSCIGQSPPHDHPRVALTVGYDDRAVCPYCATRYRFEEPLPLITANISRNQSLSIPGPRAAITDLRR